MRRYAVRRAAAVARDLSTIRQHLISAHEGFGDTNRVAVGRAAARIREAFDYMRTFAAHPHRGTTHPDLKGGVRHVTERNFVFYFEIDEPNARSEFSPSFSVARTI